MISPEWAYGVKQRFTNRRLRLRTPSLDVAKEFTTKGTKTTKDSCWSCSNTPTPTSSPMPFTPGHRSFSTSSLFVLFVFFVVRFCHIKASPPAGRVA